MLVVEVQLDGQVQHKSSVPLCRTDRGNPASQGQQGRVEVFLRPTRAIRWTGYRDQADHSQASQMLELDIWQTGAEPDEALLGVSVATADRILMNTIHFASPDKRRQTEIAPGLLVLTYPVLTGR